MDQKVTIRQRIGGFMTFLWNGEEKKLMGRGARSWGEIGLFYLIYYICLSGFFAGLLAVFYQTIDDHYPRLLGSDSLLKGNPGVGFKPMPDVDTTLIRYEKADPKSVEPYVKHITDHLKKYQEPKHTDNIVNCSSFALRKEEKTACRFEVDDLIEKCGVGMGYKEGTPCILLKLNKIFDWIPEPYEVDALPENMPKDVKDNYNDTAIWISCEGENPGDGDNLGPVEYYPTQGFPLHFYPFHQQKGYLQPLVMAHFKQVQPHVGIMIECKAWAQNIRHSRTFVEGSIHFELLID